MKKSITTLICAILVSSVSPQAQAATKPVDVINGFQKNLSNTESALATFNAKNEANRSESLRAYEAALKTADSTRDAEILNANNLYETKLKKEPEWERINFLDQKLQASKDAAQQKRNLALKKSNSDFHKLKLNLSNVAAIKTAFAKDAQEINKIFSKEVLSANQLYESQMSNIQKSARFKALYQQWQDAKIAANTRYANAYSDARDARSPASDASEEQLYAISDAFYKKIFDLEAAIRAAQHASETPLDFDRAFVTALNFECNQNGLYEDSSSWDKNLRVKADEIWWSYKDSEAQIINQTLGSFYTSNPRFQAQSIFVSDEYKKLTQISLKF